MVSDAIRLMDEKNVGALPVVDNKTLVGIVSERDYIRKVIVKERSSKDTPVNDIMTKQVLTVSPSNSVTECMQIMTERRVRHLPVLEGTKLVGILSMRDVVTWLMSAQKATIDNLLLDYHGSSPFEKFGRGELGLSGGLACPAEFRF